MKHRKAPDGAADRRMTAVRVPRKAWSDAFAILAACLVLLASACGRKANPGLRIGVVGLESSGGEATRIIEALRQASAGPSEVFVLTDPALKADIASETAACLAHGATVLAVCLGDPKDAGAAIEQAKGKRVPVVFVGRKPGADDMVRWDKLYYVGTREGDGPTLQGEIAAAWWNSHPAADRNRDSRLQYVIFSGETGGPGELRDAEYCVKALGDAGIKSERLAEVPDSQGGDGRKSAQSAMAGVLAKYGPRLEFVICDTPEAALGSLDALREAGFFKGGKHLPVVARGTDRPILEAVRDGELLGTVLDDDGRKGRVVYELSAALVRGGEIDDLEWPISENKYIWVPCRKITAETAASLLGR